MASSTNKEILGRLMTGIGTLTKLAPEQTKSFLAFNNTVSKPGTLDTKTKELIAVALAVGSRCDGCIAVHVNGALKAGAKPEEIGEALAVAVSMGGGPSLVYASRALEALDEFAKT